MLLLAGTSIWIYVGCTWWVISWVLYWPHFYTILSMCITSITVGPNTPLSMGTIKIATMCKCKCLCHLMLTPHRAGLTACAKSRVQAILVIVSKSTKLLWMSDDIEWLKPNLNIYLHCWWLMITMSLCYIVTYYIILAYLLADSLCSFTKKVPWRTHQILS